MRARVVLFSFVLGLVLVATATSGLNRNWSTHAKGGNEIPPNPSLAQGQAKFQLSEDGTSLDYKLIVANLEDVLQAHIHLGSPDENGPVVAFLYPSGPPPVLIPGTSNGVLAEGTITSANLIGPLAGEELSALVNAMNEGNTYVNVHTVDLPGGEIRANID